MNDSITIPRPDDFHAHFRSGPAMAAYLRRHAAQFGRAIAMPNTVPPVASAEGLIAYRESLLAAAAQGGTGARGGAAPAFEPLMTFKLLPGMSADTVRACAAAGAVAGKLYPAGATTNSADGIGSIDEAHDALRAMEELGLVLCVHAEDPAAPVFEREAAFLPALERLMARHPKLKVVFEHVSSAEGMRFVMAGPERLGATVTAVHLLYTREDMLGEGMNPHLYCKPIVKTAMDRAALREAVLGGANRVFFGSDSAPHPRAAKECARAASGVYSAPTALCALIGLFDREGAGQAAFAAFVAERGADFYGLPRPDAARGALTLAREPWTVPAEMDGCVPMCAGETLPWRIA